MLRAKERWKPGMTRERSVSNGRFKLVERPKFEGGYSRTLYDTRAEREETSDVRAEHPEVYRELSQALAEWTANVPGYFQGATQRRGRSPAESAWLHRLRGAAHSGSEFARLRTWAARLAYGSLDSPSFAARFR